MAVMMKCGHASNATQMDNNKPVCVVCAGISPGWDEIDETPPSLEGRIMRCSDCGQERPSDSNAAFFRRIEGDGPDRFYSGCRGWD